MRGSILLVDDEESWTDLVQFWLGKAGYNDIRVAGTGLEALKLARENPPDCVLLDLVLPDKSGLEVCKEMRAVPELSRVPVVLLTAHKKERLLGLLSGVDYFVGKSENPNELLATLEALFRRREMDAGMLQSGGLVLRSLERQAQYAGEAAVVLTPKAFQLLYALVQRSPQPVSREELYRLLEKRETGEPSRALDVLINRLRKALPPAVAQRILSVKGFGYVYIGDEDGRKA